MVLSCFPFLKNIARNHNSFLTIGFISRMALQISLVMKKLLAFMMLAMLTFAFISCEKEPLQQVTPQLQEYTAPSIGEIEFRGKDCFNFRTNFEGCLGVIPLEIGGVTRWGFGAMPSPATVGEYEGYFASIILETTPPDVHNGATHYVLVHKFWMENGDYFYTEDRAVCSPATGTGATCMINDQMKIVGGTGVFENVSGKVKTHGPLTMGVPCSNPDAWGTLVLELHGHVCLN